MVEKTGCVAGRNFYGETLASCIPLRVTHVYHIKGPVHRFTGERAVNTVIRKVEPKTLKYKEARINGPIKPV